MRVDNICLYVWRFVGADNICAYVFGGLHWRIIFVHMFLAVCMDG